MKPRTGFTCPRCDKNILRREWPNQIYVTCGYCGTLIGVRSKNGEVTTLVFGRPAPVAIKGGRIKNPDQIFQSRPVKLS